MIALLASHYAAIFGILGGSAYIAACEFRSTGPGQCESQWIGGLAMMGVGTSYNAGFNTLNPALRKPEDEQPQVEVVMSEPEIIPPPEPEPTDAVVPPSPRGFTPARRPRQ